VAGDATAMPLPDAYYDAVISQEAFLHIPDKAAVIAQCARVVKPAGTIAFTDVVLRSPLNAQEESRIAAEMHAPGIASVERYLELFAANRCALERREDLSKEWTHALVERHAMYRSLRDTTSAKFGEAHFAAWDRTYGFFVGLFMSGKLGGTRIVARKEI
jgi:ubiquinone/menaquinone biosynthesis C-methylase UbiE